MYTRGAGKTRVVVGVYVDDLIITGANPKEVGAFKEEMRRLFRMSDLGLLSYYLGIEEKQGRNAITLGQATYAKKLLEKAGLASCKSISTPMEVRLRLSTKSTTPTVDATMYRSLVGSLRYLVHTRPDIAFAVGYASRFMETLRQEHLVAVKHLLRYIAGMIDYGLVYPKLSNGVNNLVGYTDSDMGGDVDERRCTAGVLFFLGDMPRVPAIVFVSGGGRRQGEALIVDHFVEFVRRDGELTEGPQLIAVLLVGKAAEKLASHHYEF
ncbi:uncharacterized mitochondrial protein AtMg00810-like [Miscanthus floridulus]|uniref:uncharacterized mitochondrial protein AtMg00810-like n=1 Tax=Miscanthus floridulus TaxID=154761 RepID=UPI003457E346